MNIALLQKSLTMSSRLIAELADKPHSNVCRTVETLTKNKLIKGYPQIEYTHPQNGKTYYEYFIEKRDSYVVMAQVSPEFTAALVDRWQELETSGGIQLPKTLPEALRLAADLAEQNAQQQLVIEQQQPSVEFVEKLVDRTGLMTATEVAQKHKLSAMKLNLILDKIGGVYSKSVKRSRVFCQTFVDKGYGQMKQTDVGHSQCLFTTAGEFYVSKLLKHYFEQNT